MKISRILNNNVVIIHNEQGNEQVVCGKGIAYQKKIGDEINQNQINKVFILKNQNQNQKFQELLEEIPLKHIQVADEIIEMIKMNLGKKINDSIYISLSDHLYTAIQRFLEGITIKNSLLWDIKRFYELEFSLGIKALDIIEKHFKIRLPDDEASFIAIHIVNAEMDDGNIEQILEITKIMQEISNIVKYYFSIEFDTTSVYFYRFITHLKFFAQRLIMNKMIVDSQEDELWDLLKIKYQTSCNCAEKISNFIQHKYHCICSNEEKLYLAIHIERLVYKSIK